MPSSSSYRVGWCPHKKPKYSPEMRRSIINSPTSCHWFVTSCLGKFTHHSVYLAKSRINKDQEEDKLPSEIVIKSSEMSIAYQLKNEKKILSQIKSPFVVSFYGHEMSLKKDEKDPFKRSVVYNTIHEYGRSLANHVKIHDGNIPEDDVRRFASDILLGLKYIRGEKIIHCDIKAENILLVHEDNKSISSSDGFVAKISGFLRAIEKGSVEYGDGLGHKRGTVRYLSPEELREDMVLDYSSDVWAYGCTVFEMLTGEWVWKEYGKLRWERMVSLIGESDVVPLIPDYLSESAKDFLSKCLERDPAKRWSVDTLLEHEFLQYIDEEEDQEEDVEAYAANLIFEEAFQEEELEEAFEEEEEEAFEEEEEPFEEEEEEPFEEEEEPFEEEEEEEQEQDETELDGDYPKASDSEDGL